ncbi:MAG: NYN domain-containing protein [Actinobacteria bacterium]|nr:NYN domain-containing protein [Actinomycetota bacterium]
MTPLKRPRPLHVIDIDNLMGDPRVIDPWVIGKWQSAYVRTTGLQTGDHAIIGTGCNGKHAFAVQSTWKSFRVVRRPGPDGADEALIEAAIAEAERGRYAHFIIGSGDRRFADLFDILVAKGYPVTVVSRPRSLSRALRSRAGNRVLSLPDLDLI